MAAEELRTTNAVNGMRARRFGRAINYAAAMPRAAVQQEEQPVTQTYTAAPAQAPAPNINTQVPQVPNVQPSEPVTPTQPTAPTTPVAQPQSVQPTRQVAQTMPARPGVTANPLTDPYAYIEQMYGPSETLEERQARERREYNNQRIANMLGLFTGIGNMLVTSGSRYGRKVDSPDFATAAAKGIMTNEVKRREEDKSRLAAVQKQQQLDAQREKMQRDADERAWNHAYKVRKDAADDKWRREKDARDAAYRKGKDDADMAFKREQADKQNKISMGRLAEQRRHNSVMEGKSGGSGGTRGGGGRSSGSYTDVPVPGYDRGVRVSKTAWNSMKKRQMYSELVKEKPEWFTQNGWGERNDIGDIARLKEDELEQAIVEYIHANPDSEASKRAVQELVRMRDSDPSEDIPSRGGGNGEEEEEGGTFW